MRINCNWRPISFSFFLSLRFYRLNYCFPMPIWIYPLGVNFVLEIKSRHGRKSLNLEISASPCTNVIFIMYSHTPSVVFTYGPFGRYGLCINIKVSMKQRSTFYSLSLYANYNCFLEAPIQVQAVERSMKAQLLFRNCGEETKTM